MNWTWVAVAFYAAFVVWLVTDRLDRIGKVLDSILSELREQRRH